MLERRERLIALVFGLGCVIQSPCAQGSSTVDELLREARAHEAAREEDIALKRYTEALALDPTCGPCYLGLGTLRSHLGDVREAERVFSVALAHVPAYGEALYARARARRALGWRDEANEDLEAYAAKEDNPLARLRELAHWYGEDGRAPAQLAVWRRILVRAELHDPPLAAEARRTVRALQILVGPADPVASPGGDDPTRRALAAIARRGG